MYLIKTNAAGDTLWTRTFGSSGDDHGYSVQQTMDGGYIIAGRTYDYNDAFLVKTNADGIVTWVLDRKTTPGKLTLEQNYPNPFNPITTIVYNVAQAGLITLKIFNILGQEVATLVNELQIAGTYRVLWQGENFPSGVYFYRLQAGPVNETKKLILLK
jgi:hypothetical protein